MKLKKKDYLLILLCLLVVKIPFISQTANNLFMLLIEIILILTLKNISLRIIKKNMSALFFAFAMVLCTILNMGISTRTINAIVTGIDYFLLFYLSYYLGQHYTASYTIHFFRVFLIIMVTIADLSIFLTLLTGTVSSHGGIYNTYIIGNKFIVSYYHMFLISLFQTEFNNPGKLIKFVLFSVYSIFICYTIQCNTGVLGCACTFFLSLLVIKKDALSKFLSNPIVFCLIFIGTNVLFIGTDFLFQNNFITSLLTRFSHTSKILTGRLDMYKIAINAFKGSPLIGYGINCTVVQDSLTFGNAQNGMLKLLIDYGIVGVIGYLMVCYYSLNQKASSNKKHKKGMIVAFLYGMMICSLVEINISQLYIVAFALYNVSLRYE